MGVNYKKPLWSLVIVGSVAAMFLGYLVGGAWESGIQAPAFITNFIQVMNKPFGNYFNRFTIPAMVVMLISYGFVLLMYYTSRRNFMHGREHGSARLASPEEVNKKIADKDEGKNQVLSQNLRLSINTRNTRLNNNKMILGGSGAGKTLFMILPNILQLLKKVSMIFTDPKAELLQKVGNLLRKNGYKVKVLNLIDMKQSDCYNPFAYIRTQTDVIKLITNLMANTTPKNSQSTDPFWEKAESLFLQAIFYYVWMESKPHEKNFRTVLKLMEEAEVMEQGKPSRLDVRMKFLEETNPLGKNHPAVNSYNKCMRGAGDTIRSIIVSVNSRLAFLENEDVLRILSKDDMNIAELGIGVNGDEETRTALFCVIPDNDKSYNFIVGMFYTQIFQELYYQADYHYNGRLPIHVSFMLDEFANVALPEDFCSLLSTMRSREISATIVLQNLAQIKALFKDTWETITGNCDTLIYLGGNEQSTHKYISESLGKATIDKQSSGETRGMHGSASRNFDVLGREILTPDEARKLDNTKSLVFVRGFDPVLDDKFDTFHHPVFEQTSMGKGQVYVHTPTISENFTDQSFELLSPKAVSFFEKKREQGENIYIDSLTYAEFSLLGEMEYKNRIQKQDEEQQKEKHNKEHAKELEYEEAETASSVNGEKSIGSRKPELKGEDSITNRMVTWIYTKEQKDELRKALESNMPRDEILKFFYPEISAEEMAVKREAFKKQSRKN